MIFYCKNCSWQKFVAAFVMILGTFLVLQAAQNFQYPQTNRLKVNFDIGWKFKLGDVTGAEAKVFDDAAWSTVNLPHNFETIPVNGNNSYYRGLGWYRKSLALDNTYQDKVITLYFEGAVSVADVYINGTHLPTNYGGFHPFCFDITQYCSFDGTSNIIAVKLDNSSNKQVPPENPVTDMDYNMYGGINKDVYLIATDKLYIPEAVESWDAGFTGKGGHYITYSNISTGSATVNVETWVKNVTGAVAACSLSTFIVDAVSGAVVGQDGVAQNALSGSTTHFTQSLTVTSPKLWAPWSPNLYYVHTVVYNTTTPVDIYSTRIGIRKITYNPAQGVFCNDVHMKIFGLNRTNQWPFIGHATPNNQQRRDAEVLREYGCNFVRCSHYPMDDAFYDACDSVGLLLWVEIPTWHCCAAPSTDSLWRARNGEEVKFMVRNGRNRASIMIWGVGLNEGAPDATFETPQNTICINEDASRPTSTARQAWDFPSGAGANIFSFYGQNRFQVGDLPSANPDPSTVGYLNTEHTGHTYELYSRRDINSESELLGQADRHMWMTVNNRLYPWCAGGLGWCAMDYYTTRGTTAAYGIKPHGVFDIMHFPKFAAYFYKSQSAGDNYDGSVHPYVKIASFYTQTSPNNTIYSNCDSVRLYQNSTLIGTNGPDTSFLSRVAHPPFLFNVTWQVNTMLIAEGLINSVVVARDTARIPGTPTALKLVADPPVLVANGQDISRIEAYVVDANGTTVPYTTNAITYAITGNGKLIGDNPIAAQSGSCINLVKAELTSGTISVTASADGLTSKSISLTVNTMPDLGVMPLAHKKHFTNILQDRWSKIATDRFVLPVNPNTQMTVSIYNVAGKLLRTKTVSRSVLSLKKDFALSSGLYLVKMKHIPLTK